MFYCQVICQVYNLLTILPALGWPQIWLYFTVTASGQTLVYMWLHDLQDEWHDEGILRAELAIWLHCPLGHALGIEAVLPVGLATEIRSFQSTRATAHLLDRPRREALVGEHLAFSRGTGCELMQTVMPLLPFFCGTLLFILFFLKNPKMNTVSRKSH